MNLNNLLRLHQDFSKLPAIIGAFPLTLTNGTTIDAIPVMTLFNYIQSQVNANAQPLGGTAFPFAGTAGGSANALTLTPSPALGAYAAGVSYSFKVGASTNTASVTLAVSGLSAQALVNPDGVALQYGQLFAGAIAQVMYDGTNFQLVGQTIGSINLVTPTANFSGVSTGITYGTRQLAYWFVGQTLYFSLVLTFTNKGSAGSGTLNIIGLPIAPNAAYVSVGPMPCVTSLVDYTGYTYLQGAVAGSSTTLNVAKCGTATTANNYINFGDCENGSTVWISGSYAR
jgi:hypothetical protein